MEIVVKKKVIPLDGISGELGADVRGMVALLFSEALRTWERGFCMNLNSDRILETINSCTAKMVMRVGAGSTKAEMLDVFMDKYADLQDAIFEDAPRGCGLALAWPVVDDADQLSVQAIALINPYQVDAFDEHAFGETAQKLGLVVSYYDEDAEAGRWKGG